MPRLSKIGIRTSYYAKYSGNHGVSIALYKPKWFNGEEYEDLFPPPSLLEEYKKGNVTQDEYIKIYREQVLDKLDPEKVYRDLKGKALLCYEVADDFCHRHIVADWLETELKITVVEYKRGKVVWLRNQLRQQVKEKRPIRKKHKTRTPIRAQRNLKEKITQKLIS